MLPHNTRNLRLGLLACSALISACLGRNDDTALPYCQPEANAGADLSTALGASVELDGTESGYAENCATQELTFEWAFQSVPVDSASDDSSFTDNNTNSAQTTAFIPDVTGTYVLSLVVCDYLECSNPDLTVITVSAGDSAPIANAGPDVTGQVDSRIEVDGSASYDPEGAALDYSWSLTTLPDCSAMDSESVYDPNGAVASFLPDCDGVYIASLVVSDGTQWSEPDYVTITVRDQDLPPVADAGDSSSLPPCNGESIALNGNGSYDPEGAGLDYLWSLVTAPADSTATNANIADPTAPETEFTWDLEGEYTFQLQVFDGGYWSAPDIVNYTVLGTTDNSRPQANAGENQAADLEADCTSSSYTWSCDDCGSVEFDLDASGSFDNDGDSLSYSWSDLSGQLVMGSEQTAFATAITPTMAATYGSQSSASFDVELTVSDCLTEDDDTTRISLTCTGVSSN